MNWHDTCGECDHMDINEETLDFKCKIHDKKVEKDTSRCDEYILRSDLVREGAVCEVCEYYMMDDYCCYKKAYILDVLWEVCEGFEPCEEYLKGQLGI